MEGVAVLGLWHMLGPWHMLGSHLELESRVSGVNKMMVGEAGKGDWDQVNATLKDFYAVVNETPSPICAPEIHSWVFSDTEPVF